MIPGLFVVGTDTDVGKTWTAQAIARTWAASGRRVGVLKPVSSGGSVHDGRLISADGEALIEAVGGSIPRDVVAPMVFAEPMAPPVAARRSGTLLTRADVILAVAGSLAWWADHGVDALVVEGVGGLLCPLAEGWTVADLAVLLDYPLIIVAHRGLGTLNQTLLTVEAARSRSLRVAGVVLNGARAPGDPDVEAANAGELARRLEGVAILADWDHRASGDRPPTVAPEAGGWYDLAKAPRYPSALWPSPSKERP